MIATARSQIRILARDPILLALVAVIFVSILIFVVYPLAMVFIASFQERGEWTTANYSLMAERRLYRNALWNSLSVGAVVGLVGVFVGYIAAFVLTRLNVPGKRMLHYLMIVPIISPPFVSAVSILFL